MLEMLHPFWILAEAPWPRAPSAGSLLMLLVLRATTRTCLPETLGLPYLPVTTQPDNTGAPIPVSAYLRVQFR